jgi:hypothetical protein
MPVGWSLGIAHNYGCPCLLAVLRSSQSYRNRSSSQVTTNQSAVVVKRGIRPMGMPMVLPTQASDGLTSTRVSRGYPDVPATALWVALRIAELGPGTDEGVEDGSQVEQDGDRNAGFEDDTDFQAAPLRTARERSLVAAGQKVIDVGVRLLKALMAALLRQSAALSTAASVEPWESLLWHTQTVQRGVEDMAAALIPPQVSIRCSACL